MKSILYIAFLAILHLTSNIYASESHIELGSMLEKHMQRSPSRNENDDTKDLSLDISSPTRTISTTHIEQNASNSCRLIACGTIILAAAVGMGVGLRYLLGPSCPQPTIYCFDNIPDDSYDVSSGKWSVVHSKYDTIGYWPTNCVAYKANGTLPTDKELLMAVNRWFLSPRWTKVPYKGPYCIKSDKKCPASEEDNSYCLASWDPILDFNEPSSSFNDTQSPASIPTLYETFANTTIANNTAVNVTNNATNDNATQMNETRTTSKQHKLKLQQALWSALAPTNVVEQNAHTKNNSRKNLARSNATAYRPLNN